MKRVLAAFTLFTRLPFWRITNIPQECYSQAVVFWPLTGWLTGGFTAAIMYACSFVMPWPMAVITGLVAKLLLTGALHEDGLADFCDAFGCGGGKERILSIMKDSHIGTYGVIGLIMYYTLTIAILSSTDVIIAVLAVAACDPFAKLCAGQLTNILPYARPEGAKNKISYSRMNLLQMMVQILFGILPVAMFIYLFPRLTMILALLAPVTATGLLVWYMRTKIGGYTGDCCGAAYLICELTMLMSVNLIWWNAL